MSKDALSLASEFSSVSEADWYALVEKTLNGKSFDAVMQKKTLDGVAVNALYTQSNAKLSNVVSKKTHGWDIRSNHWDGDPKAVNAAILENLRKGATSFSVFVAEEAYPGVAVKDLSKVLEGVYFDLAITQIIPGEVFEASSKILFDSIDASNTDKASAKIEMGIDPIGVLAQSGRLLTTLDEALLASAATAKKAHATYQSVKTYGVNTQAYHAAGGTEVDEIAVALSTGVAYLKAMENVGLSLEDAAKQITFTLAVDANLYLNVAKLRAVRTLWAEVLRACGVEDVPMTLGVVTATRMLTKRDPWGNVLRGTVACLAGAVGGADSISLSPHDGLLGLPTDFSERIARNIQIILQEESHIGAVIDPVAGSYAFETLTSALMDAGWAAFQTLEEQGGIIAAIRSGSMQKDMAAKWQKRHMDIAVRKTQITGVSEYPNIEEAPVFGKPWPNVEKTPSKAGETVEPLMCHNRNAQAFEAFRDQADAFKKATGDWPTAYVINVGKPSDYIARTAFAKNALEAGGIKVIDVNKGEVGPETIEQLKKFKARLVVISASDEFYKDGVEQLMAMLKEIGLPNVHGVLRPALVAAENLPLIPIYQGMDVLALLKEAMQQIGDAS